MAAVEPLSRIFSRFVPKDCPAESFGIEVFDTGIIFIGEIDAYHDQYNLTCEESDFNNPVCQQCQLLYGILINFEKNLS